VRDLLALRHRRREARPGEAAADTEDEIGVLQEMPEIRQNFKKLSEALLLKGDYPALATHDDELIAWVKSFTANHGIGKKKFEFQMLYGVRPDTQRKLAAEGYNMRVYVPYGTHWLPYFYRRLRERKENVYFVLKNLFRT
jgi:proline dehydrogenase